LSTWKCFITVSDATQPSTTWLRWLSRNQQSPDPTVHRLWVGSFQNHVDPAPLFSEIADTIRRFIVLESEQADTAALWVAHTYLIDDFDISPIAIINAPEKACAKTLFQTVLARMSYRPLPASNASTSALFRAIELWGPAIFFDEADTFFRDNSELQGMVNAGYKRGGFILRSEAAGDSFEPRMFSVFSAKSIAGIALEKHLPDSTMSRGIVFNLRRKLPHESVSRFRHADSEMFEVIACKLARFALDYSKQVRLARPTLPDELSDRAQDNWEPLLAIAECAGPDWVQRATVAALRLSSAGQASVSTGNELLADIQEVFENEKVLKISTADLIQALVDDDEKSWATYNRGKPISPRQLSRQLAGYGIKSKTVRLGPHHTPKGFDAAQFTDAFARYLATPTKLPQPSNDTPESINGMAGRVAGETQPCSNDAAADCVADDPPQDLIRNAPATEVALPALESGEVAGKPTPLTSPPGIAF
jgi:putative DNA primase/helicase